MNNKKGNKARVFFGYGGLGRNSEEVSDIVTRVGPLVRAEETEPGVPSTASFSVELLPVDGDDSRLGYLFDSEVVTCELYWTSSNSPRPPLTSKLFFGVLNGSPKLSESATESRLVANFVGALAGLWEDEEIKVFTGDRIYPDIETEIIPALLETSRLPIKKREIKLPRGDAYGPFWSPVGRPSADLLGISEDEAALCAVRSPVWDPVRGVIYVGFGPFVCKYDGREWSCSGELKYVGRDPSMTEMNWHVVYLEYDEEHGRLLGVAETAEDDIRKRSAHIKARFTVEL